MSIKLTTEQENAVDIISSRLMKGERITTFQAPAGSGKALSNSTKIPTFKGIKLMKDLKVDDIIIGSNGKPTKIMGVYPQGEKDIYTVYFENGAKVNCCQEHLWNVGEQGQNYQTKDLKSIIDGLDSHKYCVLGNPIVEYPNETPLSKEEMNIEVGDYKEKTHMPNHLKYNSVENRSKILDGLFGTTNIVNTKQTWFYQSFKCKQLALDIKEMAQSIGLWSIISRIFDTDTYTVILSKGADYIEISDIVYSHREEATCIKVDADDSLFLVEDFIPTHNTVTTSFLVNAMNHMNFANASPTGAAARNLTNKGAEATTIHRLIYTPIIRNGIVTGFKKKSRFELMEQGINAIVIDEYSMVSHEVMEDLESYNIPLLLVGDIDQLPPISSPNKYINTVHAKLDTVMRQALESDILRLATELRVNGTKPLKGVYKDIGIFGKHELQDSWIQPNVPIIVGKNDTRKEMNLRVTGTTNPSVGDKIMILKNNYELGVVNGQTGIIKKIRHFFGQSYVIDFEDEHTLEKYTDVPMIWGELISNAPFRRNSIYAVHGYSSTCHKFQGQTLDKVLIFDESYIMREEDLKRKWLYTALTRAKERAILLY